MGIGILIIFLIPVLLVTLIPDAHAVSRSEIYHMKNNLASIENEHLAVTQDIAQQRDIITSLEKVVTDYTDRERTATQWDRFAGTEASRNERDTAVSNLHNAQNELTDANTKLQRLITQSLSIETTKIQLEKKIKHDEDLIKKNSKIELQGLTRVIGVELSKTCKTLLTNNYPTTCPTYEQLLQLDTSKPQSGTFQIINGLYQRGAPSYQNDHKLYDFEKDFMIIVNPSGNIASRIKMITIENNFDTYLTAYDNKKQNNTRTLNHDRFIDSCKNAIINSDVWESLLPTTIYDLRNGCISSQFNEVETIQDPITTIDITTSPHWQFQQKQFADKIKCKGLCFEY